MKRKKVITVIAMAMTCATIASCGKATETVNAEPVQLTEQIVLETETEVTPQVSADLGEGTSLSLEPQMVDGIEVYPDYPETYIKFTPIDPPKEMYCIDMCTQYLNPNMWEGKLESYRTFSMPGDKLTFNATCEVEGKQYYRFTQENTNLSLIVPADCWSETPPEDTDSSNTNTPTDDEMLDTLFPGLSENEASMIDDDRPVLPEYDESEWDNIDPSIIDQLDDLVYE